MTEDKKYVFSLEPNEEYSERCGEVFLTNIGYLVFHCTLCDLKFKGFEKFADHVRDEHLLSSNYTDSFLEPELAEFNCDYDYENNELEDILHEEMYEEHINFDVFEEKDTSNIIEMYPSTNDIQLTEDSEGGAKKDDDIITNPNGTNNILSNEIQKRTENSEDFSNTADIRPIRKGYRSKIPLEERKHKCFICGVAFKDKHNLTHHIMRHSNAKKFPCSQCDKKFFTAAERRVHFRTHTQERQHLCSECGLRFITNVLLVNHMKRHNNQRDFQCPHCEKSFYEKSRLTAHLYAHSNQKPYECKICGSGYMHSRSLKSHMALHEIS